MSQLKALLNTVFSILGSRFRNYTSSENTCDSKLHYSNTDSHIDDASKIIYWIIYKIESDLSTKPVFINKYPDGGRILKFPDIAVIFHSPTTPLCVECRNHLPASLDCRRLEIIHNIFHITLCMVVSSREPLIRVKSLYLAEPILPEYLHALASYYLERALYKSDLFRKFVRKIWFEIITE
jgi:hypothetical protein